jgi:general L-amino acid transport system substrate-binding protein
MRHAIAWPALASALFFFSVILPSGVATAAPVTVLDAVKARGTVVCGVSGSSPGFSEVNARGEWRGLDVDFCAALAAAVLGNKDAVKFLSLTPNNRFKALQDGEIDVLLSDAAWTLTRDSDLGARFTSVLFYDGQGFIIPRNHSIASVFELSGTTICALAGSGGEQTVADFFGPREMRYKLVKSDRWDELLRTYGAGGCTVLTGDISLLASERSHLAAPADHVILPETISKEPLGPAVKMGDDQWFGIVRWTAMALIEGEELGLTRDNIETMKASALMDIRRFLGLESDLGAPLGLSRDWAYRIVKAVGNYGEIYDRSFGERSNLKIDRGLNKLWTKGGLMFAMPLR